jgi:ABC-type multidrug transport system fused ATPase/permease subunit
MQKVIQNNPIWRVFLILNRRDRLKIVVITFFQTLFNFIDLIGIALFGVLGSLAVTGSSSRPSGDRVTQVLNFLQINSYSLQTQAAILGSAAAALLVMKTLLSLYFTRKTMYFLSTRGALITKELTSKILSLPLEKIQTRSLQENIYALTGGVGNLTNNILGSFILAIADFSLVLIMLFGLFYVDPTISVLALVIFGGVAVALYFALHGKAKELGDYRANMNHKSIELIQEVFDSYREIFVGNKKDFYIRAISDQQIGMARNTAQVVFLPNISKYVLEISIITGTVLISAFQFTRGDAAQAAGVLAVFLAASTRIGPAILRIQQSAIQIVNNLAAVKPSLELINELEILKSESIEPSRFSQDHGDDVWESILIKNLNFKYGDSHVQNLTNINLEIPFGKIVSVVGKSGAGKTTLIDVILGINNPTSGTVEISGKNPSSFYKNYPGSFAYLPQNSIIINGTVRENICMGYSSAEVSNEHVIEALKKAHLLDFVNQLPGQLDASIGDRGSKLSGGQKQRLAIARALLTKPRILVMDEATSALDNETEVEIAKSIQSLRGTTTVILIAHRLSSVKNSDLIIYLGNGEILAFDNFENVQKKVPDFEKSVNFLRF